MMLFGRIGFLITLLCAIPVIIIPTRSIIFCEMLGSFLIPSQIDKRLGFLETSDFSPQKQRDRAISDGDIVSHILYKNSYSNPLLTKTRSEQSNLMNLEIITSRYQESYEFESPTIVDDVIGDVLF